MSGLQISDSDGNITLDTTTFTIKEVAIYANSSITTNGTISIPAVSNTSIVSVVNNTETGDPTTSVARPNVELDVDDSVVRVSNGVSGFDIGIRVLEL